jgi:xanthine dehydrogenase accessory factor
MLKMQYLKRVEELERTQVPFALATVVQRRAPVSAHLGDRAIVTADGTMEGFVGGSCSRDIVRHQGLDAIRTGVPRLLQIRPDPLESPDDDNGLVVVPMGCASEGAVDVYIEPHLPPRTLLIIGDTPVAASLARLGSALDEYRVEHITDIEALPQRLAAIGAQRDRLVAVVASQGHYDERALATLLSGETQAFVGLLASRKRAAAVFGALQQGGIARERLAEVRNPVGLDLGGRTPGEVAVSILAEIVAACVPNVQIDRSGGHHCCHT